MRDSDDGEIVHAVDAPPLSPPVPRALEAASPPPPALSPSLAEPVAKSQRLKLDLVSAIDIPPILDRLDARVTQCIFAINKSHSRIAATYHPNILVRSVSQRVGGEDGGGNDSDSISEPSLTWDHNDSREFIDEYGVITRHQHIYHPPIDLDYDVDHHISALVNADDSEVRSLCWYRCEGDDWLLVGMASGWLRCYHWTGKLVHAHQYHDTPLIHIKYRRYNANTLAAQAQSAAQSTLSATSQATTAASLGSLMDMLLVYRDVLCVVDGRSIRAHLRLVLHAAQSILTVQDTVSASTRVPGGVWSHRRWRLTKQACVNDAIPCNAIEPASMEEMFVLPSISASQTHEYFMAVGSDPMVAFYAPKDEPLSLAGAVTLAGALTSAVASAVTSTVFGYAKSWLSSSSKNNQAAATAAKKKSRSAPIIEPLIDLPTTRVLRDDSRSIDTIRLDPVVGRWAATTDSMGRVAIIDARYFTVVRLLKGYREAQTAWLAKPGLLSLAIYAPRRGLLELWSAPLGPRIGAINVGYGCSLIPAAISANPKLSNKWANASARYPQSHEDKDRFPLVHLITAKGKLLRIEAV